jgi:phosphoribosylaminoimidazole-succinocarboxamide synthase
MNILKTEQLYEGKAKKVYATTDPDLVIVDYKDDATAFNGEKKGTITGKGVINNKLTNFLMKMLEANGVPTHFVEEISDRETIVRKVTIIPLEVIVRNIAAGSFSKRFGVEEGKVLLSPTLEFSYKDDALGDPMINTYHIKALGLATDEELQTLAELSFKVNKLLSDYLLKDNIILVDFKLEFGKTSDGKIVLADEISPDTCRFWDKDTKQKLDKDRFRRNLGGEVEAYQEISNRVLG